MEIHKGGKQMTLEERVDKLKKKLSWPKVRDIYLEAKRKVV